MQAQLGAPTIEATVDQSGTAVVREPVFTLRFERAIAEPEQNAVWLMDGPLSDTLIADARRATLSASQMTRKIAIITELDRATRRTLWVRPVEPLLPGQQLTLITTTRLLDRTGRVVSAQNGEPVRLTTRVCASPDCPTVARLRAPRADAAPVSTQRITLQFDRPIHPTIEGPVGFFSRADGQEVAGVAYLDCAVGLSWRCVRFATDEPLEPNTSYQLTIGALADGRDLLASNRRFELRTGEATALAAAAPNAIPLANCSLDESRMGAFCVRLTHHSLSVRALLDRVGQLRVRAGELVAESETGTSVTAVIEPLTPNAHLAPIVTTLAADTAAGRDYRLEPIRSLPTVPPIRITEVYARPRGSSAQEFVELEQVGPVSISLANFTLRTSSGSSALPDVMLAPGVRAVIVGPTFDVAGDSRRADPPVAPGALVVRLNQRVAQRGLQDRGSDVWLADLQGIEVSRCPTSSPERAPRLGVSVVRADLLIDERDPAAWMYDARDGATPGGVDRLR